MTMRQFFPKMDDDLARFGISPIPNRLDGFYGSELLCNCYTAEDPECPKILPITRSMLGTLLRRLVFKYRANVTFMNGTVDKLIRSTDDPTKLSGVSVRTAQGDKIERASFIDSTGVAQLSYHKLLKDAGFSAALPQRIEYKPHLNYLQTVWNIPDPLINQIVKILPASLKGTLYMNLPDWSYRAGNYMFNTKTWART
ncbi:hypothetical protein FRB94_009680 [Tulasnella sp. JGI-2019a]|nr:hypothetical protein FRB94_009680 [Tulasnella sp. JGI-2019a]